MSKLKQVVMRCILQGFLALLAVAVPGLVLATPFTTTVPGTGVPLPDEYPEAGGVAIVLTGANGNIYYQFSDPDGAFVGFQNRGRPTAFRGNPFTINDPLALDCGFRVCTDYFGGSIARIDIRFSAYDGDTQSGGFDENDINLVINGFDVGSWSGLTTEKTNDAGTTSFGFETGFGNNTFNTGWFSSTNPALLDNILTSEQTTTQVRDDDPNDNYWDFRRGESLPDESLRTIAPGYELEKTRDGGSTTFAAVGQQIDYTYIVRNIGSVDISNIEVNDDKIGAVSCNPTTLPKTAMGGTAPTSTCTATYTVTQEDFDAGVLTNIATATGDPEFGTLGALTDSVTLTGPAIAPAIDLAKVAQPTTFTAVGQQITFTITATNTGDATLSDVVISDPDLGLNCSFAAIAPLSSENTDNDEVCVGTYIITQSDIDNAGNGTQLINNASVTSKDPNGVTRSDTAQATVTGPAAAPAMTVEKTALVANFAAVGDLINYQINIKNTGNVTWPGPPAITDALTSDEACPAGPVAPGATVTCTASYAVQQTDLDAEEVANIVSATITVGGQTANGSAGVTVPADVQPGMSVEKTLSSGPNPFSATTDQLVYSYVVRNTGNVVLNNVNLSDDKIGLTCPATTIPAGGSITCTSASYTVTQSNLNDGGVTNLATATATTGTGGAVDNATATLTVPADQQPSLAMVKTAGPLAGGILVAGETIEYDYQVTNNGNVDLAGPFTVVDDKFTDPIACPAGALAPGDSVTCEATYTITSADVAALFVTNTAYATDGTTQSPTDSESVPAGGAPAVTLTKESTDATFTPATVTFTSTGDTLYYRFTVTNTGATAIDASTQPITVNDPQLGTVDCSAQPATLFPQGGGAPSSFFCTGSFAGLTQTDIDAGFFTNTATASFPAGGMTVTSPEARATVQSGITPGLTLDKIAPVPGTYAAVGDVMTFTFRVTNTSVQTIASVDVTDPLIQGLSCSITNLGPSASQDCTGDYIIKQADLDNGAVNNTATANGVSSTGVPISDTDMATVTIDPAANTRDLSIDKQASTTSFAVVGDEIDYVIEVRNTGNITITDAVATDAQLGLSCPLPALAPGDVSRICKGTHVVTQADIDAGSFVNTASVSATGVPAKTDGVTATGPARQPSLTFAKTADGPFAAAGETVNFAFAVRNTGNVTLTNVQITDPAPFFTPAYTCTIATLAPGALDNTTCSAAYVTDQDDVDAGSITNTANVVADTPLGSQLTDSASETVQGPVESIALRVEKTEKDGTGDFGAVGATETYSFTIFNDSNVTVTNINITDPMVGLNCAVADLAPGASTVTCDGGPIFESDYTVDQDDIDFGAITNEVTVTGATAQTPSITVTDTLTLPGPDQLPALTVDKTSSTADFDAVGDVISYSYLVTNTGNVTLTSAITVNDNKTNVTCPALPAAGIPPLGTLTCTASYAVTQADLDADQVTNIASATVTQAVVPNATYPGGVATVTSPNDTVTVGADQQPALSIVKGIASGTSSTYTATSDVITFAFTVTNTGNVTTTAPITITDGPLGLTNYACGGAGVVPGGSVTCTATWSPGQGDIDSGSFTNSATAATVFDGAGVTTPTPATATAYAVQTPEMTVSKALRGSSLPVFQTGATAIYDYTVTNTGNQTIIGPVTVEDNLIPTVTCPTGNLAPGASLSCTGSYIVTVDDVKLGSVTNIATGKSITVDSPPVSETIPTNADPAIEITKVADVASFNAVGQQITYTYTVTNTSPGNPPTNPAPALANDIVIVDDKFATPLACFTSTAANPDLAPGETVTCSQQGIYTVTQADLDAVAAGLPTGFVTNNAQGETTFPGVPQVVSPPVSVTVPGTDNAALTVTKAVTSGNTPAAVNNPLVYTITVANTGNQTVSGIIVSDPMLSNLACTFNSAPAPANLVLAPGESATCTGDYVVTQDDIDAQSLVNTATATGANPQGRTVTDTGSIPHPLVDDAPAVTAVKDLRDGEPGTAFSAVDEEIVYTVTVTNSGNVTLASTAVTDVLFPGEVCNIGPLAPGASDNSCEFTYTVTQADIDRGFIDNLATATSVADTPDATVVSDDDTLTGTGPLREPTISVTKASTVTTFASAGVVIPYTYTVANTGNVTITAQPSVTDDKISAVSCPSLPAGGLAPGTFITCSGSYTLSQVDVDAGQITNIATVSVANPLNPTQTITGTDTLTITGSRAPSFTVAKLASDDTLVDVGDTITYTYSVTNTGNVTLAPVTLTDAHTSSAGTANLSLANGGVIASVAPGSVATLTGTYVVTQDDVDDGGDLTNTVTAAATPPSGVTPPADQTASEVVTVASPAPSLEVIKTVTAPATLAPGQPVVFDVAVTNNGNVTLTGITMADTMTRNDLSVVSPAPVPVYQSGDAGVVGTLEVGETWVYRFTHVLTQADMDAGGLRNTARAGGTDPFGTNVTDISDNGTGNGSSPTVLAIPPMPAIEGTKTITSATVAVGTTVRFEIAVQNTGNVTLNSVAVAQDTLTRADGTPLTLTQAPSFFMADAGSPAGSLQVDETAIYRAAYVLTQDDIDAGGIRNAAVVTGTPPVGGPVQDETDDGDDGDGNSANDPTELVVPALPALSVDKALTSGGPTFDAVGDVLGYTFTVTNTGNVTLTDQISINDPLITDAGGTITCAPPPLAPMDSLTCSGSYTVTQADLDAGQVDNSATAQVGTTLSPADETSTPALQLPAMETVKAAVAITTGGVTYSDLLSEYFVTGAVVDYTYTVTNTGNVTLTDAISVSDNLIDPVSCPALPTGGLAPGSNLVCTGSYTVSADDVRLSAVTNLASATSGTTTSPLVSETVPADGMPSLGITKDLTAVNNPDTSVAADLTFDEVGDVLTYTFTVTNTGTVAFAAPVTVEDDKISGSIACYTPDAGNPDLIPGESVTCSASYTVTQDDLNAGQVVNQAYAETLFGAANQPVVSAPVSETAPGNLNPAIAISKSAATLPITGVGQVLTYTLTLDNIGNQTLTNVVATDPLLPALSCSVAEMVPGASETCSGSYTVTQGDIDAGSLVNTAAVTAVTPQGGAVSGTTSLTTAVPAAAPGLTLVKSASPDPFGAVGSGVTYTFAATNTGNVTLFDVTVTDAALDAAYACVIPRLAVGSTDAFCTLNHVITQDDKDAGEITNTASASGRDPFGTTTTASDTITTPSVPAMPGIAATKTASLSGTIAGAVADYTLTLRNIGDVTLSVGTITDTMTRKDGVPIGLDAPFAYQSGDLDGDLKLDVSEVWTYTARHTLTQGEVDAGGFDNSVVVTATDPFGTVVTDTSDDGDATDGNVTDDVTEVNIVPGPAIETVKTVLTAGSVAGDTVVFAIAVRNVGNVSLTGVNVTDTLRRSDGTALSVPAPVRTDPTTAVAIIAPTEVWTYRLSYTLTQDDVDGGGLTNTATASGMGPDGTVVSDVSDNGNDADGNLTDDETVLAIMPAPDFDVVKTTTPLVGRVDAGDVVSFEITVTNRGNVTLRDLVLTDTLTNYDGDALTPDAVTLTSGASETEIGAGSANVYAVTYTLQQADVDAGGVRNTAAADVTTPGGVPLQDVSDDGDDTDGNALDDPTEVPIAPVVSIETTKEASPLTRIAEDRFEVAFTITVNNLGNVTEENLVIEDDLNAFITPATLEGVTVPVAVNFVSGSGGANVAYNGTSDINLVLPETHLSPGVMGTIDFTVTFDATNGFPAQPNFVLTNGDNLTDSETATAGVTPVSTADIFASKAATPEQVQLGTVVTYTLTFENREPGAEANLTIVDEMPAGVVYSGGSARYNGASTPQPTLRGGDLYWENITIGALETVTITLEARVVGELGEMVNEAYVLGPDGNPVSNIAAAAIYRRPEAVFDCGDVIGKVFDDRNLNGYPDGEEGPDRRLITDQTYDGSKGTRAPEEGTPHEPGLPGVRLSTVDGTVITTDAFGRFSVPCAALPARNGSNFILKLDDRTLPTGYQVTTENPRVVRLTPGTVAKMNFGAALANVVDIDLVAAAFGAGSATPGAALVSGINSLADQLADVPALLNLTYYVASEGRNIARERLDSVEELVRQAWRARGSRLPVVIERTIRNMQ